LYFAWIKIETLVFIVSILSVFIFLVIRTIMSSFGQKLKCEINDMYTIDSHDILNKNYYNVQLMQVMVINLTTSLYLGV